MTTELPRGEYQVVIPRFVTLTHPDPPEGLSIYIMRFDPYGIWLQGRSGTRVVSDVKCLHHSVYEKPNSDWTPSFVRETSVYGCVGFFCMTAATFDPPTDWKLRNAMLLELLNIARMSGCAVSCEGEKWGDRLFKKRVIKNGNMAYYVPELGEIG